jgi:hypothetical protein
MMSEVREILVGCKAGFFGPGADGSSFVRAVDHLLNGVLGLVVGVAGRRSFLVN